MEEDMSTQEQQLCQFLAELPAQYQHRYNKDASRMLLKSLFWALAGGNESHMRLLFPEGTPNESLNLGDAQGAVEGAEYTESARGKRCGHIFKPGEASYMCRTCGTDETCCLCSRCFDSTDHTGHMVRIHLSVGNSGCCDCGDDEAWKTPLFCTIHSDVQAGEHKGKEKEAAGLPEDMVRNLRMTIGRVLDYICDVISCSPEQLRQAKTVESLRKDEQRSRLQSKYYGSESEPCDEFALVLWNDEKHTVQEVEDQIARAVRKSRRSANADAWEVDAVGRSILTYVSDLEKLLHMAKVMEAIRVTVTIRSARDTFREQMCGTLVEWLADISGSSVGHDNQILRRIVCEEVMRPWRQGSSAFRTKGVIDDEEEDDQHMESQFGTSARFLFAMQTVGGNTTLAALARLGEVTDDDIGSEPGTDEEEGDDAEMEGQGAQPRPASAGAAAATTEDDDDVMMVDTQADTTEGDESDVGMNWGQPDQALEEDEATMAGYPPPPPPPPGDPRPAGRDRDGTPSDSDTADPLVGPAMHAKANRDIPKTPGTVKPAKPKPGRYWIETPAAYLDTENVPPAEDVFKRVRLDWLLLFDLRMWKKVRNDLRALYISTVVQVPEFKRVLALRFASLYTVLAELYLIGDREPDHSIINLSLQMLTTPSITVDVVERGNFMSSLLAILYTFLTTRQVGNPWDVSPAATLAFESGSVTNRRMYHFYQDLKYLFGAPHVQERIRCEPRYLMQFLDLVKLHQCIGPNIRAVVEHVEYEADSWITASLVTRQINLQARNISEAFRRCPPEEIHHLQHAIRFTAKTVIVNAIGAERARFTNGEIKEEVRYKTLNDFEFDTDAGSYDVIKFVVEKDPISFHHALHYTLSWLIECGRSMSPAEIRTLLSFTPQELKAEPRLMGRPKINARDYSAEDYLMAALDYPLRVCAWLAQIKANMWVRNGISLRHQASTYRGVGQRDVSHNRDIFLLQTAMVICNPNRVMASIVDRFGMDQWVRGIFELKSEAQDDSQHLDVVEDMIHLLIILLSDRTSLIAPEDEPCPRLLAMRRDITHVLCFKPLSFNEICNKMPEKYQEQEDFPKILDEMATFKPPEGISDVGTFELRAEFIEDIDPYIAHYSRNQREESEMAYRKKMAKRTGKTIEEVVYEPKPRSTPSGLFKDLGAFINTGLFAQVIYFSLIYPLVSHKFTPTIPFTRLETFLQVILHLILLAVHEDHADDDDPNKQDASFVHNALTRPARTILLTEVEQTRTIVSLLNLMSSKEEFKTVHPKIALVLKRLKQKQPRTFEAACFNMGVVVDRLNTASPANNGAEEEKDRKKKAALSRQAKVMASFQQQQKNFLANQTNIDWGSDLEDDEELMSTEERKHNWKYPTGTCILCQEEADDRKLYGTFALVNPSQILRQTDLQDPDIVREASQTPCSLDRSAEDIRPFGIARENRKVVEKFNAQGETFLAERQTIGKGFPAKLSKTGPVATGCGHMMHYSCFETYYEATNRRHTHQIARHHPEDTKRNEFVCPLCKALGNAFVPIAWKGLEESYPGQLVAKTDLSDFVEKHLSSAHLAGGGKAKEHSSMASPDLSTPSLPGSLVESIIRPESATEVVWHMDEDEEPLPEPPSAPALMSATFPERGAMDFPERPPAAETNDHTIINELIVAYRRLKDTLRLNDLETRHPLEGDAESGDELCASDTLVQTVAFSISAAEIQQRGIGAESGATLLAKMPEQMLSHLRILSETASSFISVGMRRAFGKGLIEKEYQKDGERQHCQLFVARYLETSTAHSRRAMDTYPPLLSTEIFNFMVECAYGMMPLQQMEIAHVLRLCYLAELVKVVYYMGLNMPSNHWIGALMNRAEMDTPTLDPITNFAQFAMVITQLSLDHRAARGHDEGSESNKENLGFQQPGVDTLESWHTFVKKYALVFLRKSAMLLYVRYGVDLKSHISPNPDADELDRLTEALRLPSFDEMCASLTPNAAQAGWSESTKPLVSAWIQHHALFPTASPDSSDTSSAVLSHPGIFELIGLPKTYDTLIEEATRRKCPTTGKDLTDPVICLFCGDLLCSQGTCCQAKDPLSHRRHGTRMGGAQQHMRKCQGTIGAFLNVRKCSTIYLFRLSGSFTSAPYIDKYGETDPQLRHGRQLFLNQKRYDSMVRNTVLNHGIPSLISRKLEAEINNGGWDTL